MVLAPNLYCMGLGRLDVSLLAGLLFFKSLMLSFTHFGQVKRRTSTEAPSSSYKGSIVPEREIKNSFLIAKEAIRTIVELF